MHIYLLEMPRTEGPSSFYVGQSTRSPEESTNYWGGGVFCLSYRKKHDTQWIRENVKKTVLLRDLPSQEALNYWEKFAIADYRERFPGRVVNHADGGKEGPKGLWECDKHRTKMEKMYESPEYKAKRSEISKKLWECDEYKTKMEKINKSPECRTKKSKAAKKRWESDEYRAKMEKIGKERWESDEFKAKMGKVYKSPEFKAKHSEAWRGEKNPRYNINSVQQILGRIEATEGVRIPSTTFRRALKNAKHPKHIEYTELFNRYKVDEG